MSTTIIQPKCHPYHTGKIIIIVIIIIIETTTTTTTTTEPLLTAVRQLAGQHLNCENNVGKAIVASKVEFSCERGHQQQEDILWSTGVPD